MTLAEETQALLCGYPWPGNVRELQNAMQRAVVIAEGSTIRPGDLPVRVREHASTQQERPPVLVGPAADEVAVARNTRIADLEKKAVVDALAATNGNVTEAVKLLGIGRTTVYRMMKRYGLR